MRNINGRLPHTHPLLGTWLTTQDVPQLGIKVWRIYHIQGITLENQQREWLTETERCWSPSLSLKGPDTHLQGLTISDRQPWHSRLKGARDIQGGTQLSGFRAKARGAVFCHTEVI